MMISDNRSKGFSLIEILIAIAILALVALGIMALLPGGYKQITNSGRSATINHLGQMKLDYLRTLPISHWDLTVGLMPTTGPQFPIAGDKYTIRWTVSDYTSLANSKSVLVEVGYDIYHTDGTVKAANQALDQKRVLFPTIISQ